MSSMVFTEKDAQKKAKNNSAFYGNKLDEPKNKRKEKNSGKK